MRRKRFTWLVQQLFAKLTMKVLEDPRDFPILTMNTPD